MDNQGIMYRRLIAAHGERAVKALEDKFYEMVALEDTETEHAADERANLFFGPLTDEEYANARKAWADYNAAPRASEEAERQLHAMWRSLGEKDCSTAVIGHNLGIYA